MNFRAVVLAGERPGQVHPVAAAAGVRFAVLAPIAGRPMLARVLDTLAAAPAIDGGVIVGDLALPECDLDVATAAASAGFVWRAAASGPSASAATGVAALEHFPVLLTTGDHPLLDPATVGEFCAAVCASDADFLIAYVRHADVQTRLPATRRTRIAFAGEGICGCNLFAVRTPAGVGALRLWQRVEADRKRPWRVMTMLGAGALLRYLLGRLTFSAALLRLSALADCRIEALRLARPEMAVDVDTAGDWALVQKLFAARAAPGDDSEAGSAGSAGRTGDSGSASVRVSGGGG